MRILTIAKFRNCDDLKAGNMAPDMSPEFVSGPPSQRKPGNSRECDTQRLLAYELKRDDYIANLAYSKLNIKYLYIRTQKARNRGNIRAPVLSTTGNSPMMQWPDSSVRLTSR